MRTFSVYGVRDDGHAVAAEEVSAASPAEACVIAERMFADCPLVEVWEESVLIARIRRAA